MRVCAAASHLDCLYVLLHVFPPFCLDYFFSILSGLLHFSLLIFELDYYHFQTPVVCELATGLLRALYLLTPPPRSALLMGELPLSQSVALFV